MARPRFDKLLQRTFSERPIHATQLRESLVDAALPTLSFFLMLGISAAIAWIGLMANSTAVIIGAMIVAPLMNPMMTMSFGIASGDWRLIFGPAIILLAGVLFVVAISYGLSSILATRIIGSEVIGRTNPNLLDLGVAIGAGVAGAFARSRNSIANALPGVAMAVALVPPLCVVGYGLSLESQAIVDPRYSLVDDIVNVETGAALLFLVNFCAIILFGSLVFLLQGYGRWKSATPGMLASLGLTVLIAAPLLSSMDDFIRRDRVLETLADVALGDPGWERVWLENIVIDADENPVLVRLDIIAPRGVVDAGRIEELDRAITIQLGREIDLSVNLFVFDILSPDEGKQP